jgi:hypothetical protein
MTMLLLIAAATAAAPKPGELRTFRDWAVGCDNGRACHATSLLPEDSDQEPNVMVSVERAAGANAPPRLTVMGSEGKGFTLAADGNTFRLRPAPGTSDQRVDSAETGAALAAMRSSAALTVEDGRGRSLGTISLAGISAALLYMDETQKRIGTVTALVRPGTRPAGAVPPPPPLPTVRSAAAHGTLKVDDARIAALRTESECIAENADWPGYDVEQQPLDADHSLILLGCGAGAYNYSYVPYVATRRGGRVAVAQATFDLRPDWGESATPMLVNAAWDPKEGLLTSFSKGRGLGDCGIGSDYAWDGQKFRLVHQTEMHECRGSVDYITTWRATVVTR